MNVLKGKTAYKICYANGERFVTRAQTIIIKWEGLKEYAW